MEEKANARGHSSPRQTATLAREAAVGRLIMTHISSRYDDKGCQRLLAECRAIFRRRSWLTIFLFSRFSAPFFVLIADNTKKGRLS
ncbi:putative metal-dependent hydrolase [Salmonella enterica subsp. enterica]|nr:putative metal-dependent hydrolase [Salmonella enterica subsp. enterica]